MSEHTLHEVGWFWMTSMWTGILLQVGLMRAVNWSKGLSQPCAERQQATIVNNGGILTGDVCIHISHTVSTKL